MSTEKHLHFDEVMASLNIAIQALSSRGEYERAKKLETIKNGLMAHGHKCGAVENAGPTLLDCIKALHVHSCHETASGLALVREYLFEGQKEAPEEERSALEEILPGVIQLLYHDNAEKKEVIDILEGYCYASRIPVMMCQNCGWRGFNQRGMTGHFDPTDKVHCSRCGWLTSFEGAFKEQGSKEGIDMDSAFNMFRDPCPEGPKESPKEDDPTHEYAVVGHKGETAGSIGPTLLGPVDGAQRMQEVDAAVARNIKHLEAARSSLHRVTFIGIGPGGMRSICDMLDDLNGLIESLDLKNSSETPREDHTNS